MTAVIPISPTSPLAPILASFVAFLLDEKLMHGPGTHKPQGVLNDLKNGGLAARMDLSFNKNRLGGL